MTQGLLDDPTAIAPIGSPVPGSTVVCTLGMHRSGTSLVSRLLNLLGVDLGPQPVVNSIGGDNPRGYWEHPSVRDINDEILARFGGYWHDPPAFPPQWTHDPRLADVHDRAGRLVSRSFAGKRLWGWKDPRTCLTLPFWQAVVGPMRYVVCVRNPCAVAESLVLRNGIRFAQAERLWLAHTQAALAHTTGQARLFVFYEELLDDWRPQLRRMAAFVGDPRRGDDPKIHAAVAGYLDRELWHHRHSLEDVIGSHGVSTATKSVYALLCANQEQATTMDTLRTHRDRLTTRVADLSEATSALDREHAAAVDALERERQALAATIRAIHTSTSWRLAAAARDALATLLPYGTRRRLVAERWVRAIARRLSRTHAPIVAPRPA